MKGSNKSKRIGLKYFFPSGVSIFNTSEYKQLVSDFRYYLRKVSFKGVVSPEIRYRGSVSHLAGVASGNFDPKEVIWHCFWWHYGSGFDGPYRMSEDLTIILVGEFDSSDLVDFARVVEVDFD